MAVKKYTIAQVAEALRKGDGILSVAAEILGCHRNTIYNYLEDDPELKDVLEESRETLVDEAEKILLKKVKEEDIRCVMFVLRTLGRHRGYNSRPGYAAEEPSNKLLPPAPNFWDEILPFEQKSEPEAAHLAAGLETDFEAFLGALALYRRVREDRNGNGFNRKDWEPTRASTRLVAS